MSRTSATYTTVNVLHLCKTIVHTWRPWRKKGAKRRYCEPTTYLHYGLTSTRRLIRTSWSKQDMDLVKSSTLSAFQLTMRAPSHSANVQAGTTPRLDEDF